MSVITGRSHNGSRLGVCLGTALLYAVLVPSGHADTAQAEKYGVSAVLEEIIVTATRRSESLQDTGASVSVLSSEGLATRSIHRFEDIAPFVPAIHIASYQGDTSIFIRGIGTPAIIAGNDSSTATYVDGVYLSRAAAIGPAFLDVERLEVLRGPQGTLYGRNATGGAINIITKGPGAELEGEARLTAGNYDRYQAFGAVGGPLTERLGARLAVQLENRNGYSTLHRPAGSTARDRQDAEDRRDLSARLKIRAELNENVALELAGDYYRADDRANVFHYASAGYADEIPGWTTSREGAQTTPYFLFKNTGRSTAPRSRDIYTDIDFRRDTEIWGLAGTLEWAVREYDLKLIAGYRDTNPGLQNEFDLSDAFVNRYQREEDHWQWSTEILLSSPQAERFSWVAGGYYFREENDIRNDIFGDFWEPILIQGLTDLQNAGVIPAFPIDIPQTTLCCELHLNGMQKTRAWAGYLDLQYEVSDRLSLRLGGRYSWEERDGAQRFELTMENPAPGGEAIRFAPNAALFPGSVSDSRDGVVPDPFGFVVAPVNGPRNFSAFTPKFGIEYRISDTMLSYVSAQKGFKSGGYNIGSSQRDPFEPESIWSYEAGVKSDLAGGRLRLNAAAFHYDYTNLQAQDSIGNQPIIRNVGKAEVQGVELETVALIGAHLRIDGAVTYADATFTRGQLTEPLRPAPLDQPPGTLLRDLDGLRLPRAPKWKFNLGAQVDAPVAGIGDVVLRVDYGWQSKIYYTVFNIDAASEGSYGQLSARIELLPHNARWSIAAYGRNLTDETYFSNMILTGTVYGAEFVGSLGAPRAYGLELSVSL
jgi:iron complex outermembrane recepter protein